MAGFPLAGTYRTPDGVTANVMEQLGADWDDWTAHDDTYVVDGENVVVLARYTATNKATGKDINVRVAHHFVVRGGSSSASNSSSTPHWSATPCRRLAPDAHGHLHPRRVQRALEPVGARRA